MYPFFEYKQYYTFCVIHSLEMRGLCLMKWDPVKRLKISHIMYVHTRTQKLLIPYLIRSYYLLFSPKRIAKNWSVSLGHSINHKPLISKECAYQNPKKIRNSRNHHQWLLAGQNLSDINILTASCHSIELSSKAKIPWPRCSKNRK